MWAACVVQYTRTRSRVHESEGGKRRKEMGWDESVVRRDNDKTHPDESFKWNRSTNVTYVNSNWGGWGVRIPSGSEKNKKAVSRTQHTYDRSTDDDKNESPTLPPARYLSSVIYK